MNGRSVLSSLGVLLLLAGCSGTAENPEVQSAVPPESAATTAPQAFNKPLITQSGSPNVPAVPGLLQSTNAKARSNVLEIGRRDPFASVPGTGSVVPATPAKPVVNVAPLPAKPQASNQKLPTIALPKTPTHQPPALPDLRSSALPPGTPPGAVSLAVPPPSPTALAESIEVSGVVQVGGKWSVIVKEPSASSSRYVSVGDYLENGKVLVKQIVSPDGTTPVVVLQQNGLEIRKALV